MKQCPFCHREVGGEVVNHHDGEKHIQHYCDHCDALEIMPWEDDYDPESMINWRLNTVDISL